MKKLLLLFMFAGLLISCSDDDSGPDARLDDFWTMSNYSGFVFPQPELDPNEIVWSIDLNKRELIIANSIPDEYPYLLGSGTYQIKADNANLTIETLSENPKWKYKFTEDGKLELYKPPVDGADESLIR